MKALLLTTDAFGGSGGIAKYNRDLLRSLCSFPAFTEVVALPRRVSHPPGSLPPKLTYITSANGSKLLYLKYVANLLTSGSKFDLIVCGHINLLPLAYLAKLFLSAPLVLMCYGIDAWQPTRSHVTNAIVSRVDKVISITDFTKERFMGWARVKPDKVEVLPPAVNLSHYSPGPKRKELLRRYGLDGKTVIMTLGRLAPTEQYKGFDQIIELLPTLRGKIPDLAYLIVGEGDDRLRLAQKAESLGVSGNVVFTGFVPESEKADCYRLADAYVMPSSGEGFGIVFLEAMACGIPVLGSKIDGSREALRYGRLGTLVDPANSQELLAGILATLARSKGAVPQGLDYFSFENFERRCHHLLGKFLSIRE